MEGIQKMSLELGSIIKEQWQKVVESNKNYPKQGTVKIPLTNLEIDSKSIYLFLREFSTILNDNPNLFTLVHDGKNILRAYAEGTKDGVYNSLEKIELDGWEKAIQLQNTKATFHYLKGIAEGRTGIDIGILKIAHIDFFKEFQPVFDEKNSNLESICHMYNCTRKVIDKNLIELYPEPKLFKFLRETKNIQLKPEFLEKNITKWVPNENYGLLIKSDDGLVGVIISKHDQNLYIEFPREEVDELGDGDLKSLTTLYRKKLGLSMALGLEANALKNVINKISNYSLKDKELANEIIEFIKTDYEKSLYIDINSVLNPIKSKLIKYSPSWPAKKIWHELQKRIFN